MLQFDWVAKDTSIIIIIIVLFYLFCVHYLILLSKLNSISICFTYLNVDNNDAIIGNNRKKNNKSGKINVTSISTIAKRLAAQFSHSSVDDFRFFFYKFVSKKFSYLYKSQSENVCKMCAAKVHNKKHFENS